MRASTRDPRYLIVDTSTAAEGRSIQNFEKESSHLLELRRAPSAAITNVEVCRGPNKEGQKYKLRKESRALPPVFTIYVSRDLKKSHGDEPSYRPPPPPDDLGNHPPPPRPTQPIKPNPILARLQHLLSPNPRHAPPLALLGIRDGLRGIIRNLLAFPIHFRE